MSAKKTYKKAKSDIKEIHKEVGKLITNVNKKNAAQGAASLTATEAANAALKARITGMNTTNRAAAVSEQDRLGIGGAGVGDYDAAAMQGLDYASQGGADILTNIANSNRSTAETGKALLGMNKGAEKEANEAAYERMVEQRKYEKQQAAYRNSFKPYGGGGGFIPYGKYGGGGGGNGSPLKGNAKVPLTYKTLPNLIAGLGDSFKKNKKKEQQRQKAIQQYYNNRAKYGGQTYR